MLQQIKKFTQYTLLIVGLGASFVLAQSPAFVSAAPPVGCPDGPAGPIDPKAHYSCPDGGMVSEGRYLSAEAVEQKRVFKPGDQTNCAPQDGAPLDSSNCGILKLVVTLTNILSAIAGVVIVMMLIVGGIQYSAAGSNPQTVSAAKEKMRNALLALFIFTFMYAFLQWIIPGGLF